MAFNVRVTVTGGVQVVDALNRIRANMPRASEDMCKDIARTFSRELVTEATSQGLLFTGSLIKDLAKVTRRASPKNGVRYSIDIPKYGFDLAYMKPHIVKIKGKPSLEAWKSAKGYKGGTILVKPHNFITPAMRRGSAQINSIIKEKMDAAIK